MSLNFDDYQRDANNWLKVVARHLVMEREQAGRIFRAVLHALRDRIPADEAVHLGSQLPIIWKGIYFDGFKIRPVPINIRTRQEWLDFIRTYDNRANVVDFPSDDEAQKSFSAVMQALKELLTEGQYNQLHHMLHDSIKELIEPQGV